MSRDFVFVLCFFCFRNLDKMEYIKVRSCRKWGWVFEQFFLCLFCFRNSLYITVTNINLYMFQKSVIKSREFQHLLDSGDYNRHFISQSFVYIPNKYFFFIIVLVNWCSY